MSNDLPLPQKGPDDLHLTEKAEFFTKSALSDESKIDTDHVSICHATPVFSLCISTQSAPHAVIPPHAARHGTLHGTTHIELADHGDCAADIARMDSEDRVGTAAKGVVRRTRNADHSDRSGRKTSLAVTFGQLAEYSNTGKTIEAQSRRYHIRQLTQRIQHDPLRFCVCVTSPFCNDFIRTYQNHGRCADRRALR